MIVAVVERWNAHAHIRQDLFGCIDLVALDEKTPGVVGVQATSGSNHNHRVTKIVAEPLAELWVRCGNRLMVISWAKKGPRGKRKVWTARMEEIGLEMFAGTAGGDG